MGMANLYLAKGQIDEAIEVCMEIIRQGSINASMANTEILFEVLTSGHTCMLLKNGVFQMTW